jgi:hypothetical protein
MFTTPCGVRSMRLIPENIYISGKLQWVISG